VVLPLGGNEVFAGAAPRAGHEFQRGVHRRRFPARGTGAPAVVPFPRNANRFAAGSGLSRFKSYKSNVTLKINWRGSIMR
jgi:hypothetical protein